MKIYINIITILLVTSFFIACKKTDADVIDISFSVDKQTVAVGSPVIFTMGFGADALAIYTGDTLKEFAKSAVAIGGNDPTNVQYIPSHPFVDSFRVDAVAGQPISNTLAVSGTAAFGSTVDSCFEFISASTNGRDTLKILPPKGGFYPPGQNNFFNQPANRNLSIFGYFRGAALTTLQVGMRVRFRIKNIWSVPADFRVTLPANRDSIFENNINLTTAYTNWATANGVANLNSIQEIQVIVGLPLATPAPALASYQGKYAIRTIRFGEKGYTAWNTGVAVQYLNFQQPATYTYTYTRPGTYIATMVASSVGRKKFAQSGYIETRLPSAQEYNVFRQVKQLQIVVQ